jgi:hypothetical protein
MKTIKTLLLIILSFTAFSQSKFQVGVESGVGISLSLKNIPDTKLSISLIDGATFQYNFTKIFSIKTGMYYERKGWRSENQLTDINGSNIGEVVTKRHLHYVSIPFLIKAAFGNKTRFFVNAGPGISFLTSAVSKRKFDTNYNLDPNIYKKKETFTNLVDNKIDVGAIFGFGIEVPFKKNLNLTIEARNNFGIRTLFSSFIRINTTNLLLGFSYKFGKKKNNAENS